MIHDLQPVFLPVTHADLSAIRAQIADGLSWREGVLTHEQALALLSEVERLQNAVAQRDLRITHLMGILS
jgi:hypothetical protein